MCLWGVRVCRMQRQGRYPLWQCWEIDEVGQLVCRGAVVGRCEAFGIGEARRAGRNLDDAFAVYCNGYRMRDLNMDGWSFAFLQCRLYRGSMSAWFIGSGVSEAIGDCRNHTRLKFAIAKSAAAERKWLPK